MRLVIFGPPGAGKGTQADLISEEYGIPHLSTGKLFRTAIEKGTELGNKVKSIIDAGKLVSDRIVIELIEDELKKDKYDPGYIIDGFPRTVPQAEAFDKLQNEIDQSLDLFILLRVPEDELIYRSVNRGEGRSDDTESKIKTRLQIYWEETRPVVDYYREKGIVEQIDGVGSIEVIFNRIKACLDNI